MEADNLFANELELQARTMFLQAKKLQSMATALNKKDPEQINKAFKKTVEEVAKKVVSTIEKNGEGMSLAVISNKLRAFDCNEVNYALQHLVDKSIIEGVTTTPPRGPTVTRFYMSKPSIFEKLAEHFGSRKALCNELEVTRQALCQYESQGYLPGLRAIEIEQKTKGKFKAAELVKQS